MASRLAVFGIGVLPVFAGCSDKDVRSYRVPIDPGTAAAAPAPEKSAAAAPELHWDAPAGWSVRPAGGLRTASFVAPGPGGKTADVSVVVLSGSGVDILANVNRWRGQLQLGPTTADRLPSDLTSLDAQAGHFVVADLRGTSPENTEPQRLIGAILEQPGRTWFFKMTGPEAAVTPQSDAFMVFLRSVSGEKGTPSPVEPDAPRAANTNDLPRPAFALAPDNPAAGTSLRWDAPRGWEHKAPNPMRKDSYGFSRGADAADVSITAFPGDVGGLAANVNRWRGQVGLAPVDEAELGSITERLEANGLSFTIVDCAGSAPPGGRRILAAILPLQGATWFFKVTGPERLVEDNKAAFVAFLGTVRLQ